MNVTDGELKANAAAWVTSDLNRTVRQTGGLVGLNVVRLGGEPSGNGIYELSNGAFRIGRSRSGKSLVLGGNGTGSLTISGSRFLTRSAMSLDNNATVGQAGGVLFEQRAAWDCHLSMDLGKRHTVKSENRIMAQTRRFFAIAYLTALETTRQPICLILATISVLTIALFPVIIAHKMGDAGKLIRDSALATHFLIGLVMATYAASSTIVKEIRSGTVSSILSKPVSRELFLLAKFAGIAAVMLVFSMMASMATLLAERAGAESFSIDKYALFPLLFSVLLAYCVAGFINHRTNRPFTSNAFWLMVMAVFMAFIVGGLLNEGGRMTAFGSKYDWNLLPACALVALGVLLLQGIATGLAIKLEAVPTLSICSILFMLGLMSDFLFGTHRDESVLADIMYTIVPNWGRFWMADMLTNPGVIPWSLVGTTAVYAGLYLAGVLAITLFVLRLIEIK